MADENRYDRSGIERGVSGEDLDPAEVEVLPRGECGLGPIETCRAVPDPDDPPIDVVALGVRLWRILRDSDRDVRKGQLPRPSAETLDCLQRWTPCEEHECSNLSVRSAFNGRSAYACGPEANRRRARSCAFRASSSRLRGGALVVSE